MEEFNNLMDGQRHVVRVLEGAVGAFHGDEFDDVVFRKASGFFDGNHFVLCAVDDEHVVGVVEVFLFPYVEVPEGFEEGGIYFHFSFKPYGNFFSLGQFVLIVVGNIAHHGLVHAYCRTAESNFGERIALLDDVAEGNVSAEAGGVVIHPFGFHHFFGVFRHQGKVGEAFFHGKFLSGVHAVAGPVEGNDRKSLVLGGEMFSEMEGACRFFAAAKAMGDNDHIIKGTGTFVAVIHNEPASYAEAAPVNIKMLFHCIASSFMKCT